MTAALTLQAIPGRLVTYRVLVLDNLILGYLRLDVCGQRWIARTPGSANSASCLRRFVDKTAAVAWLQEREPAPGCGKQRAAA